MSKVVEMQKKRAELSANMRTLIDQTDPKAGMTVEQESQWKQMDSELNNLDTSIEREKKLETLENSLGELESDPRRPAPNGSNVNPMASDDYKREFVAFVRGGATPQIQAALSIGVDSEGGFTVPESWAATLINKLEDNVTMRQLATVIATTETNNLPLVSDNGAAGWLDEAAAYPESDIAFGNLQLKAWKLGRIMKVSEELLQDTGYNIESEIARIFGITFGAAENAGFITGDGVNKPTGVLVGADNGKTAASATAITYDEMVDLVHSVRQVYRMRSNFLIKDATAGMLRKLKSTDGVPLWQPSLQMGQPDQFLGYSVRTDEDMPAVATGAKSVAFGDFSNYRIADRGGIVMQRLNELYAGTGQVGFRMRKRVDGKLLVAESVKTLTQG